jgi:hypothetical protein
VASNPIESPLNFPGVVSCITHKVTANQGGIDQDHWPCTFFGVLPPFEAAPNRSIQAVLGDHQIVGPAQQLRKTRFVFAGQPGCLSRLVTSGFKHELEDICSHNFYDGLGNDLKIVYYAGQVLRHHRLLRLEGFF